MDESEPNWTDVAERAFALLGVPIPRGKKQAYETEVAATFGLARSTLEAYLTALKFLRQLRQSHPPLAERLIQTRAPAISVKSIAQWAKIDEQAAFDFVWSHHEFRARETLQAVKEARRVAMPPAMAGAPPDIFAAFRQWNETVARGRGHGYFRLEIHQHLAELGWHDRFAFDELDWEDCDDPYAIILGVSKVGRIQDLAELTRSLDGRRPPQDDRWRRRGDRRTEMVGNITVAQRQLYESFGREAKLAWNRWVVTASLYPLTIICFPDEAALEKTLSHLPRPPHRAGWPMDWPTELRTIYEASLMEPAPGTARLFLPAPGLGFIIVTCPQRFVADCLEIS